MTHADSMNLYDSQGLWIGVGLCEHNGDIYSRSWRIALLHGVTPAEVEAEYARQGTNDGKQLVTPRHWVRGAKEIAARYGTDDPDALLTFLIEELLLVTQRN